MIILIVVAVLVFLAVRLVRVCVAAIVALWLLVDGDRGVAFRGPQHAARVTLDIAGRGPTEPQDAPRVGLWDPVRGPQDAPGGPQDARTDPSAQPPQDSVYPPATLSRGRLQPVDVEEPAAPGLARPSSKPGQIPPTGERVVALLASAVAVLLSQRANVALRELTYGRRTPWLIVVRDPGSGVAVGGDSEEQAAADRRTILDSVPRPLTGPAYLGGRDDAVYLRGWDDGVDWMRQGHPERAPSWSSAAYMTGWNDSMRAIAKARCG